MERDDDVFAQALELSPGARAEFLNRVCAGDPEQRDRIETLLAAHDEVGSFLDRPAVKPSVLPLEEKPGDVIDGRYILLAKIGEGGCGSVYLAEQRLPVQRRVALKVTKLGMDTRAVIARFEAERQALALMDHPDIARVFDAGATEAGRPYFVMELVEGVPITRFCDEQRLDIRTRLELFARVCLALQHAHQKGIIHRDVKPSNILVTLREGAPAPKIIDFGIAKATRERLTDQTFVTAVGQFIGTPAYMSPEQADRGDLDIDTRSDVYALGVVLYELLTGRLPFDPKTIAAGVDEFRRMIRENAPPRPSARLRKLEGLQTSGAGSKLPPSLSAPGGERHEQTLAAIGEARATTPRQLRIALAGDLDWIVMRCLEKDRDRRYGSARELADDVQRHLRHEPVVARPPSVGYQVERFVARNRVACASGAAIALALVMGTVVSVRQAVRATRAERIASAERDTATTASRAEALARADAQRRQEQAEDLLTFMLGDFRTELQKIGRLQLLDTVGEKAMAYFAALDPRDLTDTALARQAKALTQIGEIRMDQARYADAHAAFTAAYERAAALTTRHPKNADMLFERAQAEYWIGFVARNRGESGAARQWLTRYRDSALQLVALEGETRRAQFEVVCGYHNLAVLELDDGELAAARSAFLNEQFRLDEMLASAPQDMDLLYRRAEVASWLGTVDERNGAFEEAVVRFDEMSERYEDLARREPQAARWQVRLQDGLVMSGVVRSVMGRRDEAITAYARAEALLEGLVVTDPGNRQWQIHLLNVKIEKARVGVVTASPEVVRQDLHEARVRLETLLDAEPSSRAITRCLAAAYRLEGVVLLRNLRLVEAHRAAGRARELNEKLVSQRRADVRVLAEAARAELLAGHIAVARGNNGEAEQHWSRVLDLVLDQRGASNDWRVLDPAAQALTLLGRPDEARPLIGRLRQFGYVSLDPLAVPIFVTAPRSEPQNQ